MSQVNFKVVYTITEREGRSFWNRIGVAFVNQDGSLNVKLEALPVNGQMQIRDYTPRDELATRRRDNGARKPRPLAAATLS